MRLSIAKLVEWCRKNVNSKKTDIVYFSKRRTGSSLVGIMRLFGKDVDLSSQVKYLGVILDRKLN